MANVTLSNQVYDKLKKTTQLVLPALGSLYFGLSTIWDLPAGEEVVGSLALLTTFCGAVLGVSSKNYSSGDSVDGNMLMEKTPTGKIFRLELDGDPQDLEHQQKVVFKVVDEETAFWEDDQNKRLDDKIAD
jgi:hypothetical protein